MIDATQAVGVTNDENGLESNDEVFSIDNGLEPPAITTEEEAQGRGETRSLL